MGGKNQTLPQVLDKFAQHKKESDKGTPYDLTGNFNTFWLTRETVT